MTPDAPFDAQQSAKKLLREGRTGALATLMAGTGDPYCSLVNVATAADGSPLLLLSKLALHTKNILADARVSLMLDERKERDPLEGARVMLMGTISVVRDAAARAAYLRRHPEAQMFAGFADFAFYRIANTRVHLVAGFGRIVDLAPGDVLTEVADAQSLLDAESDAIDRLNADHAGVCRHTATKLAGAPDGDWRCVGIDPEGMELQNGRIAVRLVFPQRIITAEQLRAVLAQFAQRARA